MKLVTITTDTATICLFDPLAMRHRIDDVGDWWSLPDNELHEVRQRNAIFLNLGSDGSYSVLIGAGAREDGLALSLKVPSGRLFVGPGEQMTGGGLEPDSEWGGEFLTLEPGDYRVCISRDQDALEVCLSAHKPFENDIRELIRV
jgi:hypothetical protein